jgi:MFS family permease
MSESLPLNPNESAPKLTGIQWLICAISAIGFAFDIYTLLMLPLIIKPAMLSLGGGGPEFLPGGKDYLNWVRALFFIPAIAGGIFGLLGGYLTDLLGRRRVLTGAILLYAFSSLAAGYVTSLPQLLILRCGMFVGVSVEFVAAVAWLAELFPNAKQREKVLGSTQAFSSFGGVMVAAANGLCAHYASSLPAIHGNHAAWRYTLISGVIPALPLIFIRPFLPESPVWQKKKNAGALKRPSIAELFSPGLIKTTILTTLVFASSYGIAFGAIQQLPQILGSPKGGHKQVLEMAKAAGDKAVAEAKAKGEKPNPLTRMNATDETVAGVTSWQETGGLFGRIALALLAVWIVSRRGLLAIFAVPAMIFVPLLFWWLSGALQSDSLTMIKVGIFVAGFFVVAQFSFWGNYIPLVFPLHLRGTGESFAANIGGRVLGTLAAFFTLTFAAYSGADGKTATPVTMAQTGAIVAGCYALVGVIASFWLPEPHGKIEND